MRKIGFVSLALLAAAVTSLLVASPAAAQVKSPPDFTFDPGKDSPGKVTFSHANHVQKVEKCTACHVKVFKMKKGTSGVTMDKISAGEACGTCHNGDTKVAGKVVFAAADPANCERCHKK